MYRFATMCLVAQLSILPVISNAADGTAPSFDELVNTLRLDPSIKERALGGEIVEVERRGDMEKELATALVAVIKKPYAQVIAAVQGNRLFQFHEFMLDFVEIEGASDISKFQDVGFTMTEVEEVTAILAAEPGEKFNLSAEEIARFRKLRTKAAGLNEAELIETTNQTLRVFLSERLRRYQENGLSGIAPYQRDTSDTSSPATEIDIATQEMSKMKLFAPEFYKILQNYPTAAIKNIQHRFYVLKQNIAGRPGFILSHRIYFFGHKFTLLAARHIYAPHFYNSMQFVAGVIPHEGDTAIFLNNRSYTDQVTGFGSSMKRAVGDKQLTKGMKALLADIRAGLEAN